MATTVTGLALALASGSADQATAVIFADGAPLVIWMVVWGLAGLGLFLLSRRPRHCCGSEAEGQERRP